VLGINLLLGGVFRMRKGWRQAGVLVTHLGVVVLLAGGMVKAEWGVEGYLRLDEGMQSDQYESYTDWELVIWKADERPVTEHIVPVRALHAFSGDETGMLRHPDIPFELELSGFSRNTRPEPAAPDTPGAERSTDGYWLRPIPKSTEAAENVPGVFAVARLADGTETKALLWGMQTRAFGVVADGSTWAVDLRRRQGRMPFTVRLDRFEHAYHPNTRIPRVFKSAVTKFEEDRETAMVIEMNQPLRHKGHTLYQASWGPQDAPPGTPLYSVFAVTRDPAESLPLIASLIISAGLLLHFAGMLVLWLGAEKRGRSAA
jgi:hypothetical protein